MKIKHAVLAGVAVLSLTGCLAMPPSSITPSRSPEPSSAAQPAAEVEETPTPTPTPTVVPEAGTREDPFPAGTALVSNSWEGVIGVTNTDAGAIVAAANRFNDPAPEGFTYIAIPVDVTYTGATEANSREVRIEYVTPSGEVVDSRTYGSFVAADDNNPRQDLFTGGRVVFTEYLLVPSQNVSQGTIRATFGWINGAEGFVALR